MWFLNMFNFFNFFFFTNICHNNSNTESKYGFQRVIEVQYDIYSIDNTWKQKQSFSVTSILRYYLRISTTTKNNNKSPPPIITKVNFLHSFLVSNVNVG